MLLQKETPVEAGTGRIVTMTVVLPREWFDTQLRAWLRDAEAMGDRGRRGARSQLTVTGAPREWYVVQISLEREACDHCRPKLEAVGIQCTLGLDLLHHGGARLRDELGEEQVNGQSRRKHISQRSGREAM